MCWVARRGNQDALARALNTLHTAVSYEAQPTNQLTVPSDVSAVRCMSGTQTMGMRNRMNTFLSIHWLSSKVVRDRGYRESEVRSFFAHPQMVGYLRSDGLRGIQPPFKPAWYDHSSAFSAFQVQKTHPAAFSYEMVWASQYWRKKVLYSLLKVEALPLFPVQEAILVEPERVPS
jgi:hypothetical protein